MSDATAGDDDVYRDPLNCCIDCGSEWFEIVAGPYDRCNSCGSHRQTKRGPEDVDSSRLVTDGGERLGDEVVDVIEAANAGESDQ